MAPERIRELGLTLSRPAYLGALPWVAFEDGAIVADVGSRRHPQPPHLGRQGVRDIIAVQIGGGDHLVFLRPKAHTQILFMPFPFSCLQGLETLRTVQPFYSAAIISGLDPVS